jgi:hypothetical protein
MGSETVVTKVLKDLVACTCSLARADEHAGVRSFYPLGAGASYLEVL